MTQEVSIGCSVLEQCRPVKNKAFNFFNDIPLPRKATANDCLPKIYWFQELVVDIIVYLNRHVIVGRPAIVCLFRQFQVDSKKKTLTDCLRCLSHIPDVNATRVGAVNVGT